MKETHFDFEDMIQKIVSDEISRQLETFIVVQALGDEKTAGQKKESEYITVDELSVLTGLKKATIYAKRSRRELPAYKFGRELRFKREEVEAWMQSKKLTCFTKNVSGDGR